MDIDRAKAVSEVAREIIQSAKVEVEFMKVTGAPQGTEFIPTPAKLPKPANGSGKPRAVTFGSPTPRFEQGAD